MDPIIERDCLEYLPKIDLSPLRGKTVFLTGANGLIGTYLISLLDAANRVQGLGISIIAVSRHAPCDKLRDIFRDRYEFRTLDLAAAGPEELSGKADFIIHAATYAQPEKFTQNYSETLHLNVHATEALLKKAKTDGAKLLFLSSAEIYGSPDLAHIPTKEDFEGLCSPLCVRSIYAESKRLGETLCFVYRNFETVDAKIARVSMCYGPGVSVRDKRVLGQFLNQALTSGKITMLDDGSKERTFCYVADCVLMLLYVLLYGEDCVYNVGGGKRITIRQLAEEICLQTGSRLFVGSEELLSAPTIRSSPDCIELDTSKIRSEFSLPALKPLQEGLSRTIEWNRQHFLNS